MERGGKCVENVTRIIKVIMSQRLDIHKVNKRHIFWL